MPTTENASAPPLAAEDRAALSANIADDLGRLLDSLMTSRPTGHETKARLALIDLRRLADHLEDVAQAEDGDDAEDDWEPAQPTVSMTDYAARLFGMGSGR